MKHKPAIADIMENSIHLINENYNQPLHLNTIARQNFMSPATYSRYFFEFTQCNFSDYINQLRVEHAKNDLIYTNTSLTEIALDHGFSNSSVFSKIFKHHTQMSPSGFRKKYQVPLNPARQNSREVLLELNGLAAQPYEKPWLYAVNAGELRLLARADLQEQLLKLKAELSTQYVRVWNIFSEEFFPCGFTELKRLDFNHLDDIFDFFVHNGLKPWINLTRGPESLLRDISNVTSTLSDPAIVPASHQLSSFYENLFRHWVMRYGSNVVSEWIFECWFDDMNVNKEDIDSFINAFITIKQILSVIAPGVRVGALGNAILSMYTQIDHLMRHWPREMAPDFISIVCFPYQRLEDDTPSKLRQNTFTKMSIQIMNDILSKYKLGDIPVYVTQWNMTVSPRNAINDSCVAACVLLSNIEETLDYPWPVLYHHASDISTAQQDTLPLIFGGTGLMTKSSLFKPTFHALSFVKKMPGYCIAHGPGYMITTDKLGRFDLLLFNTCPLPDVYYQKKEYEITTSFVLNEIMAGDTVTYMIHIRTEHAAFRQSTTRLSPGQTDLLGHLQRFGDSVEPSMDEMDYLQHTVRPELTIKHVFSENRDLTVMQILNPYEIYYISLCPME